MQRWLRASFAVSLFTLGAVGAQAKTDTTTVLFTSPNPSELDQAVVITVNVTATAGAPAPTGTATVVESASPVITLGTVTIVNGTGSVAISKLAPGTHYVTAAYSGDASNSPSAAPTFKHVVNLPAATLSAVSPSQVPAGSLHTTVSLTGTNFYYGVQLLANGAPVSISIDSTTALRAILPPNVFTYAGTVTLQVKNGDALARASNALSLAVGAPATPIALSFSTSSVTASGVTAFGSVIWTIYMRGSDGYSSIIYLENGKSTDARGDGTVTWNSASDSSSRLPFIPLRSIFAATDMTMGSTRVDVPAGMYRAEKFFPLDGVQGLVNGKYTRLGDLSQFDFYTLVRPGVGAWTFEKYDFASDPVPLNAFKPVTAADPDVPASFDPNDRLVAIDDYDQAFFAIRLGDYFPQIGPGAAITIEDTTVTEGDAAGVNATFKVHLNTPQSGAVTVHYATADGTAKAEADYTATSGDLTFAPGQVEKVIAVPITSDMLSEGEETFWVNLSAPSGASLVLKSALGTIVDNDAQPVLSIADASIVEGTDPSNTTAKPMAFSVTLSHPSGTTIVVGFVVSSGTSTRLTDVGCAQCWVEFAPGETKRDIQVMVAQDDWYEGDEIFYVDITSAPNTIIGRSRAVGTIVDDDPIPAVKIADFAVVEPAGGDVTLRVAVDVVGHTEVPIRVDYQVAGGTATAGSDFTAGSGVISVNPFYGGFVPVVIHSDSLLEANETFTVTLSNPVNATLATTKATVTILDSNTAMAGAYAAAVLADRPFAYYRFQDLGSTLHDSSGNGRDGTYVPASTVDETLGYRHIVGPLGSGDPAISMKYGNSINVLVPVGGPSWQGMTVEAWVDWSTPNYGGAVFKTPNNALSFVVSRSSESTERTADGSAVYLPSFPATSGWHQVALVARSGASALYMDGVQIGAANTTAFTSLAAAPSFSIGTTFSGALDELAIYDHALSAAQLARHFAMRADTNLPRRRIIGRRASNSVSGLTGAAVAEAMAVAPPAE